MTKGRMMRGGIARALGTLRALGGLALILLVAGPARSEVRYSEAWRLSTTGVWPPAIADGKMVLKNGDVLNAYDLATGKPLWEKKLESLRYGAGVLDAGPRYVYVLGARALHVLDPATGQVVRKREVVLPSSLLYHGGSVYVAGRKGILRFDHAAEKQVGRATGVSGEIDGADGDHAAIFVHAPADTRTGPKRLVVVNLKTGAKTYEFKLLPVGWHRLVKMAGDRLVFIDYSQRITDGTNPKKLYFTEADYAQGKRIRDEALHKKHPATYAATQSDTFWAVSDASGILFIGNHGGAAGDPSALVAYDPEQSRLLWNRSGEILGMGLLLHQGVLWTGLVDGEGNAHAVGYSPDDGSQVLRLPLDSPGSGRPVAAGSRVLYRTRGSVVCLAPAPATTGTPTVDPGVSSAEAPIPTVAAPGWRLYRDRVAGYFVQTPLAWQFDRARLVKMGGLRMSIPFVRAETVQGRTTYLGSVHVLTWEAAGRDADALWKSVLAQRRQLNRDARVIQVTPVANVGGSGTPGVIGSYSFNSPGGYAIQMRSLCVVHHGVAFELRGWASPMKPQATWTEIEGIFRTFRPHRF